MVGAFFWLRDIRGSSAGQGLHQTGGLLAPCLLVLEIKLGDKSYLQRTICIHVAEYEKCSLRECFFG